MSKIEVDAIDKQSGSTLTLGGSGTAVTLACGATQTGFGRTGTVNWQTTPKTATFTAADGEGYFINSGSSITMNLPAGSAGAIVAVADYARNFNTYTFTISPNGSEKIGGVAGDALLNVNGQAATLVYVDSTKGWVNVQNAEDTETGLVPAFVAATGGTVTTVCTNFKVHTFTGPGTFCVSNAGNVAGSNELSYMVVAGGGGGGGTNLPSGPYSSGGGGGAGGFREGKSPQTPYTASPLVTTALTASAGATSVTVGGGGAGGPGTDRGTSGSPSTLLTITSAGGGGGGARAAPLSTGLDGGSGGGGGAPCTTTAAPGGSGNTPAVNPAQGTDGGAGAPNNPYSVNGANGGGGGGATAAGTDFIIPFPNSGGGPGGAGATTNINGSPTAFAGGGGGGVYRCGCTGTLGSGTGGTGGGGPGGPGAGSTSVGNGQAGTTNTGGGGGGGSTGSGGSTARSGGAGGSGIVIIRYKFQ
jgi:hypothetical protein